MEVFREFSFDAAHALPGAPEGHKCRRMHGHTYRVVVTVNGPVAPGTGWVLDFADLKAVVGPVIDRLDHNVLNEIEGLEQPTAENIAVWLWRQIKPRLPGLVSIRLWENQYSGCEYRGE